MALSQDKDTTFRDAYDQLSLSYRAIDESGLSCRGSCRW